MSTFDLRSVFNQYGWDKGFKFEVVYSNNGVARVYIGDRKTRYSVGGYGYDKESSVIAQMINDLIGKQKYSKDIYGNTCNYSSNTEESGTLCGGTGFSSIKDSFESLGDGFTLDRIYSGKTSYVYGVKFNLGGVKWKLQKNN